MNIIIYYKNLFNLIFYFLIKYYLTNLLKSNLETEMNALSNNIKIDKKNISIFKII